MLNLPTTSDLFSPRIYDSILIKYKRNIILGVEYSHKIALNCPKMIETCSFFITSVTSGQGYKRIIKKHVSDINKEMK